MPDADGFYRCVECWGLEDEPQHDEEEDAYDHGFIPDFDDDEDEDDEG